MSIERIERGDERERVRLRRAGRLSRSTFVSVLALAIAGAAVASPRATAAAGSTAGASALKEKKAPKPPVTVAEVASSVDAAKLSFTNPTEALKQDVEAELAAIDWSKSPARRQYKLSASIVALSSTNVDGKVARTSCTVSVSIREAKGGTLLAILEGRSKVEDALAASARAQRDALTGAVKGAVAAVPEAIRRAP
jgi:hypothetical protein